MRSGSMDVNISCWKNTTSSEMNCKNVSACCQNPELAPPPCYLNGSFSENIGLVEDHGIRSHVDSLELEKNEGRHIIQKTLLVLYLALLRYLCLMAVRMLC